MPALNGSRPGSTWNSDKPSRPVGANRPETPQAKRRGAEEGEMEWGDASAVILDDSPFFVPYAPFPITNNASLFPILSSLLSL